MQALVAKLFGDRHRDIGRLTAHQRRLVGRRGDDDGARETFFAQIVLDEFLHLAAALADQTDDDRIGIGVAREHGQQCRLADAGAREDAHALALAAGRERVERAHAEIELAADTRAACAAGGGLRLQRIGFRPCGSGPLPSRACRSRRSRGPARRCTDRSRRAGPRIRRGRPSVMPSSVPSGMASARPSRKPTTSQGIVLPFEPVSRTCPPRLIAPAAPVTSTRGPRSGPPGRSGEGPEWLRFP